MKKILYTILLGSSFLGFTQETTSQDALRYAIDNLNGTARFRGMSGAFGAVGGDLSAININPAGSVFFNNNYASVSASSFNKNNKASYFGTNSKDFSSKLDINQLGAVLVFNSNGEKNNDWNKIAVAINYENNNNLNNNTSFSGLNPYNSIDSYFLRFANGLGNEGVFNVANAGAYFEDLSFIDQQAWLGYNSYILEYDTTNNAYFTNVPDSGNYVQSKNSSTVGYNSKVAANVATSYKDIFSFGLNLNLHFTDFKSSSTIKESNNGLYASGASISDITFNNELYTFGNGFSLNLGMIAKATEDLRFGIAYESPTWYNLTDQLSQRVYTSRTEAPLDNDFIDESTNPNITIEFSPYKIKTPSKWTGSMAYIIAKQGLISVDITSKDYGSTKFKPTKDALFNSLNQQMSSSFKNTIDYRIGGEYKIKQFSLRAGYRFEESPYQAKIGMSDLIGYSGGIGYNFGKSKLDLSYSNDKRDYNQKLVSSGMTDSARINQISNNITLTYSVNF